MLRAFPGASMEWVMVSVVMSGMPFPALWLNDQALLGASLELDTEGCL